MVVTAANVNDCTQLDALLEQKRFHPASGTEENLCLDAGHKWKDEVAKRHGYIPHIRSRKEESDDKIRQPGKKARRWIVECFHSWTNRFKKLNPRCEKTDLSFLGLIHLAMGMITLNKVIVIYG